MVHIFGAAGLKEFLKIFYHSYIVSILVAGS